MSLLFFVLSACASKPLLPQFETREKEEAARIAAYRNTASEVKRRAAMRERDARLLILLSR